mmetsp:Transcript_18755/g.52989  ORF Transcript_18755/g.52989 Transcript_18755/m.52989 type:complete len:252 (-) Transcript_18755:78-833(-)
MGMPICGPVAAPCHAQGSAAPAPGWPQGPARPPGLPPARRSRAAAKALGWGPAPAAWTGPDGAARGPQPRALASGAPRPERPPGPDQPQPRKVPATCTRASVTTPYPRRRRAAPARTVAVLRIQWPTSPPCRRRDRRETSPWPIACSGHALHLVPPLLHALNPGTAQDSAPSVAWGRAGAVASATATPALQDPARRTSEPSCLSSGRHRRPGRRTGPDRRPALASPPPRSACPAELRSPTSPEVSANLNRT